MNHGYITRGSFYCVWVGLRMRVSEACFSFMCIACCLLAVERETKCDNYIDVQVVSQC